MSVIFSLNIFLRPGRIERHAVIFLSILLFKLCFYYGAFANLSQSCESAYRTLKILLVFAPILQSAIINRQFNLSIRSIVFVFFRRETVRCNAKGEWEITDGGNCYDRAPYNDVEANVTKNRPHWWTNCTCANIEVKSMVSINQIFFIYLTPCFYKIEA